MDGLYAMIFHIVCHFMSQEKDISYGLWIYYQWIVISQQLAAMFPMHWRQCEASMGEDAWGVEHFTLAD